MKRVWKPLAVGGFRLYKVHMNFNQHPAWHREMIVVAKSPSHAAQLIEEIYKDTTFIEKPYFFGTALDVFMPESWWTEGTPEGEYLLLLQEVQTAITFETEEQAKESLYGLPSELANKISLCLSRM